MKETTSFSIKRFILSSLGYFIIFAAIIAMFYYVSPNMLEYKFMLVSSAIVALILGVYHARYKTQEEVDKAVESDIAHLEEEIEEEVKEVGKKLHL